MKKFLFLTLYSLILFLNSIAQPVLSYYNLHPQVGETFLYHNVEADSLDHGDSGENIIWDFSNLTDIANSTIEYFNPTSSPGFTYFPGSNICFIDTAYDRYYYYYINNSIYSYLGNYNNYTSNYYFYEDSKIYMTFPFTYGSSSSDDFYCTIDSVSFITGSVHTDGVGYGTLILPFGTYNNVLKVKTVDASAMVTSSYTFASTVESYDWYLPNVHRSIFTYQFIFTSGGNSEVALYMDKNSISNGINDIENSEYFIYFPNPTNNYLYSIKEQYFELYSIDYKLLIKGCDNKIDISKLSNGIYFLKTKTKIQKIIKN